jgi:amino acid transporter
MMSREQGSGLGTWETLSIGIGGMVGGGIFAVLGLAVELAGAATPLAFALGGAVAGLTAYSYARLSVALPSQGGTVAFLDRAFGPGFWTGGLNVLLWLSYIVMLALYAHAFGAYGASLVPDADGLVRHALSTFIILALSLLNLFGARVVGEAERSIVAIKLAILVLFVAGGMAGVEAARVAPAGWPALGHVAAGGMVIFVAYEGFELIANAAEDVREPRRTLPRALYGSVLFVTLLYVLIAIVAVGRLAPAEIAAARDYALAEAARPFLGQAGFTLIAVAALLSTTSAINATLYGAARLSYCIARDGELPESLERKAWDEPLEGLFVTAAAAVLLTNVLSLSSVSALGSAGFLVVFAVVNLAGVRLARDIGARWPACALGALACLVSLAALIWHAATRFPGRVVMLAALFLLAFAVEGGWRIMTGREIHIRQPARRSLEPDAAGR